MLVKTEGLTKIYNGVLHALENVNLTVQESEFLAVMGPSGSGKSTLLNLLGALDRPTSGRVYVAGKWLAKVRDLDRFHSHTVGFIFQMHNLIPTLTAQENVEVPMRVWTFPRRVWRERAEVLLSMVGLGQRIDYLPPRLSGGERQRVAIARALANEPRLLLADEPTGNLDSTSGAEVMAVLRQLNREQGMTIFVVTHDPAIARATDRIVTLRDGQIVRDEAVKNPYLEDLREFKDSALGQILREGTIPQTVRGLGLESLLPGLQKVLAGI